MNERTFFARRRPKITSECDGRKRFINKDELQSFSFVILKNCMQLDII